MAAIQSRLNILLGEEEEARQRVQDLLDRETEMRECHIFIIIFYFDYCN